MADSPVHDLAPHAAVAKAAARAVGRSRGELEDTWQAADTVVEARVSGVQPGKSLGRRLPSRARLDSWGMGPAVG